MGDGAEGHWLVRMEWRPAGWSVCPEVLFWHRLTRVVPEKGRKMAVCVCVIESVALRTVTAVILLLILLLNAEVFDEISRVESVTDEGSTLSEAGMNECTVLSQLLCPVLLLIWTVNIT